MTVKGPGLRFHLAKVQRGATPEENDIVIGIVVGHHGVNKWGRRSERMQLPPSTAIPQPRLIEGLLQ